jgi:actin-like ATPase involved in cell morphogenesis
MTLLGIAPMVYGVDFGMSTSSLAILDPDGSVTLVTDRVPGGPRHAVSTAVCLDDSGTGLLVGQEAVNSKEKWLNAYKDNFKRDIRVDAGPVYLGGKTFRMVEVVTAVLKYLFDRAQEIDPHLPGATVLTVPVDWEDGRRSLITEAAVAAGYPAETLYLVTEPVAALEYARSLNLVADSKRVLVYDLGGGTFDCAVVNPLWPGRPRLKGFELIGGRGFDNRLLKELARRYPAQVGTVLAGDGDDARLTQKRLRETCELLKIRLSSSERVREKLTELPERVDIEVTRAQFQDLIQDAIEKTVNCCQVMLREESLNWDHVDAVVPVGGSSRIPLVQAELEARAPGKVRLISERDTAVARGAALWARERAIQTAAARGPQPQEVAPPEVWMPPAAPGDPQIAGLRPWLPFNRARLAWMWVTLIPTVAAAVGLAAWQWQWLGTGVIAGLSLVAVSGTAIVTVKKEASDETGGLIGGAAVLMALILLTVAGVLGYRAVIEHRPGSSPVVWWALGAGLGALVAGSVLAFGAEAASNARTSRRNCEADKELKRRISQQRWFGRREGEPIPDLLQPQFALPALLGFELATPAGRGAAGFQYALAAGSRVLLVSALRSADDRPELDAALAGWRSQLAGHRVTVKAILVAPGHALPVIPANEQFGLPATMTTALVFADTIGPWLEKENRIELPAIRSLLGGQVGHAGAAAGARS